MTADVIDGPAMFYQWHKDRQPCWPRVRFLNHSSKIEFHPEVLEPVIQLWSTDSPDRLKKCRVRPAETHLAEFKKFDKEVDRWMAIYRAPRQPSWRFHAS